MKEFKERNKRDTGFNHIIETELQRFSPLDKIDTEVINTV